jgi:hypothetical protein
MASFFQFSIRSLLVGVTIVAVGIAALLNAGPWWEAAVWGGTIFFLAVAILLAVYRQKEQRAHWLGFAVLGWLYLAVVVNSWTPYANPQYFRNDPLAESSLITTRLSQLAYSSILPAAKTQPTIPDPAGGAGNTPAVAFYNYYHAPNGPVATTDPASQPLPAAGSAPMGGTTPGMGISPMGPMAAGGVAFVPAMIPNPAYVPIENFTHIAHALWLLLVAAVGGKTCQFIYRTRPRTEE